MAVAKMSRLRLVGLKSDKNKIMHALVRSRLFEVAPTSLEGEKPTDRTHLDKALARQARVAFAIDYLDACAREYVLRKARNDSEVKKGKADPIPAVPIGKKDTKASGVRTVMGYDDFYDVAAKEYELMTVADALEKIELDRVEYKSQLQKNKTAVKNMLPYKRFPLRFSQLGDSGSVSIMLAYSPKPAKVDFGELPVFSETYRTDKGTLMSVIALISQKETVAAMLSSAGFTQCGYTADDTPKEILKQYAAFEKQLIADDDAALYRALEYYKYLPELKTLYDVIGHDIEQSTAELDFVATASTFVVEGWVPTDAADAVLEKVNKKTERIFYTLTDAEKEELPPTLVVSNKIIAPYEDVTNMYSVPAYGEIDPNPFMAVFFFIFFGMMIGDAGYGVILSIFAGLALRFMKFEKGTKRMLALFAMGGVSAVVWGLLFGGVFAIESVPALWFNPIEQPLMMLGVSIVLGVIHILFGYGIHSAACFREHRPWDGILDSIFIFILFGGIACLALNMLLKVEAPLQMIGLILMGVALLGILCTAGRHNKGVMGKLAGGFSGIYGLVNLLSDVLSYARIFGLGLASGAIGMAFNTLGGMLFGMSVPVLGYVLGFIILIPLHALNLGIGLLGAYVHNARLQFLEFYGKFYEGDGRPFSPMGERTKFVRFD